MPERGTEQHEIPNAICPDKQDRVRTDSGTSVPMVRSAYCSDSKAIHCLSRPRSLRLYFPHLTLLPMGKSRDMRSSEDATAEASALAAREFWAFFRRLMGPCLAPCLCAVSHQNSLNPATSYPGYQSLGQYRHHPQAEEKGRVLRSSGLSGSNFTSSQPASGFSPNTSKQSLLCMALRLLKCFK